MTHFFPQTDEQTPLVSVNNPVLIDMVKMSNQFEEIHELLCLAKFYVHDPLNVKHSDFKHMTVIPAKVEFEKVSVGSPRVISLEDENAYNRELRILASEVSLVVCIPNGPNKLSNTTIKMLVDKAVKSPYTRWLLDGIHFVSYAKLLAAIGSAVVKQNYFWNSHVVCLNYCEHDYYKTLEEESNRSRVILDTHIRTNPNINVYDWSMNHELVIGENGTALMRLLGGTPEHYEHFLGMVYSSCDAFNHNLRHAITKISVFSETNPFKISMIGDRLFIYRLHTHEHYLYNQNKRIIDMYKSGLLVEKKVDEDDKTR